MINKCLIASIIVGTSSVLGQTTIPENFSGLYAGLGVSVCYQRTNLTQDSALLTCARAAGAEGYFPLLDPPIYWAAGPLDLTSISSIRPAGSIEIGYGKPINDKFYFGAAITLDLSSTKSTRKAFTGVFDDIQLRARGNSLFIGLRLGYYLPCINSLAVFRVGGSYVGSDALLEERNTDISFHAKLRNFTPSIGLEIEKPIAKNLSIRLQADCRIICKRKLSSGMELDLNNGRSYGGEQTVKLSTESYGIRCMLIYKIPCTT